MSSPLPSHVWKLVGSEPGPITVVIGGTHGDELVGIEVVKTLLSSLGFADQPSDTYQAAGLCGTLFLILGNPAAIALRQRSASGIRDLNRCFLAADLERTPTPEDIIDLVRARELAPILAEAQFVFDLHGTSSDSPAFVCLGSDSPLHRRFYQLLPVKHVLSDPHDILARDEGRPGRGTTDEYVDRHGGMALCYETGKEDDVTRFPFILNDVLRLLQETGTIPAQHALFEKHPLPVFTTVSQEVYALLESVHAHSSTFSYAPGMDRGWQIVEHNQLVGIYADGTEERTTSAGMIVFPKAANKVQTGKNLYYLAGKVN